MKEYDHKEIEEKWQRQWAADDLYKTPSDPNNPHYVLDMFPYPSGSGLHVGHVEGYTGTDVYARFQRMLGKDVLHPMGWDAFGLPAENYAVKTGVPPREKTDESIATFKSQINRLGLSYDWDREIDTSRSDYYRWTQWLFTKLFDNDLAEKKPAKVNWCPGCQTVLANEQVVDGACERCDSQVVQKEMNQWFFNITKYSDELVDDLVDLDWPRSTKQAQRNWIGRQKGARFSFPVSAKSGEFPDLEVFTTRPDTLFGVTFMVVAPEHELVTNALDEGALENAEEVEKHRTETEAKTERERQESDEKTGVKLAGITATHPATGEEIPVYVADYVLAGYGTGAIMAVPAHDKRDFAFAQKFGIDVKQVITTYIEHCDGINDPREDVKLIDGRPCVDIIIEHPTQEKFLVQIEKAEEHTHVHLVGGGIDEDETQKEAVAKELIEETGFVNFEIKERVFQDLECLGYRHTKNANVRGFTNFYHVKLKDLEQVESEIDEGLHEIDWRTKQEVTNTITWEPHLFGWKKFIDSSVFIEEGQLINSGDFSDLSSEEAGEKITEKFGKPETTYRLRDWSVGRQRFWGCPIPVVYDPEGEAHVVPAEHLPWELPTDVLFEPTGEAPLEKSEELKKRTEKIFGEGWTPETSTLDTFVDSSWYFLRFTDPHNQAAFADADAINKWCPVDTYVGGAEHSVMHLLYARFITKALADMEYIDFREPFVSLRHQGMIMAEDGTKMSKSVGNVVNPNEVVDQVGADTLRMYELFAGPFADSVDWNTDAIAGPRRFLEKIWRLVGQHGESIKSLETPADDHVLHQTIKSVTENIHDFRFNTAISSLMELVNDFVDREQISSDALGVCIRLLAPFAPHITEELWRQLDGEGSVHQQAWPEYDEAATQKAEITIAVQVNGTVRGEIVVSQNTSESEILTQAKEQENVANWLEDTAIKREIYVEGRLVNFVTGK